MAREAFTCGFHMHEQQQCDSSQCAASDSVCGKVVVCCFARGVLDGLNLLVTLTD